jgi:hypothetical protein
MMLDEEDHFIQQIMANRDAAAAAASASDEYKRRHVG